jgi:adenylate cyclase
MLAARLKGFLRSDRAVFWRRRLTRLAGYGTAGYPEAVRRRLRIMNVAAYLIAAFNLFYALEQVILDYETWKPVIFINLALSAVALAVPFLHRFSDIAGALTLGISENIGLFVLTYILGTDSGLHMQYFAAVAGYFVVLGLGRLKLIVSLILAGLVLHLVAWAWFTQARALLHVRPYDLDDLYITAVVTTSTVVAVVVYYAFRLAEQAQEETDTLLHNILPTSIVDRLKGVPGAIIADEVADASVLFADLKGFVTLAKKLGPARTVGLLNIVVSAFDDLADQWGVEKSKTIGDAYMAAAGIPEPALDHAERLTGMALAMQTTLARIARDEKVALALRIGIATGPVLAGVIGARRLTYDVWGDTVNLASRLEGQSQPGRVLVSQSTKAHIEHRFALERYGPLDLKGFGLEEAWHVVDETDARGAQPGSEPRASPAPA